MSRALASCALVGALAAGCGSDDGPATEPGQATKNFYDAFAEGDAERACEQLSRIPQDRAGGGDQVLRLAHLEQDVNWDGPSCPEAVDNAPDKVRKAAGEVEVNPTRVSGGRAEVEVELGEAKLTVLETGGGPWKILASTQ